MSARPGSRAGVGRAAAPPRAWFVLAVYHLAFAAAFAVYMPVLLWRMLFDPRYREGIRERMGHVPRSPADRSVVWIHGVSVGEVKAASTLVARLRRERPELDLVVSATTPTGHALALKLYPDLRVIYFPLDFAWLPRRALDRVRPRCVLLMELEIWPNFLQAAAQRGIPVAVINGRISEKSFRGYRMARGLLPQFNLIHTYCVQDEAYRERLLALGVDAERIVVTGNMKYDGVLLKEPPNSSGRLREWLSPDGRLVVVGGSTHADEEVMLAEVVQRLAQRLQRPVRLVLAPRHPERSPSVREALSARGTRTTAWSAASSQAALTRLPGSHVVVVDTIGHLEGFYGACDIAFVGGSLVPHGGQNMLEPAALGRAVVFGPFTANFRTDVQLLRGADAARQVADRAALEVELARLAGDAAARAELGARAVALIRRNQGATERTLQRLGALLPPRPAASVVSEHEPVRPGLETARSGQEHEKEDQCEADQRERDGRPLQGNQEVAQ